MKKEYKAKAEGYKSLIIVGLIFYAMGVLIPSTFGLIAPFGIILFIVGIIGFAYYGAKEGSLKYCKYCGEEIPYDAMFCPKCGRGQK